MNIMIERKNEKLIYEAISKFDNLDRHVFKLTLFDVICAPDEIERYFYHIGIHDANMLNGIKADLCCDVREDLLKYESVHCKIERSSAGWVLTDVYIDSARQYPNKFELTLTAAIEKAVLNNVCHLKN